MTTGERLVTLSTIDTGTALEHFASIFPGGGGSATIEVLLGKAPEVVLQAPTIPSVEIEQPHEVELEKNPDVELDEDEFNIEVS